MDTEITQLLVRARNGEPERLAEVFDEGVRMKKDLELTI